MSLGQETASAQREESHLLEARGDLPGQVVGGWTGWACSSGGLQHEETGGQRASTEGALVLFGRRVLNTGL